MIALVRFKKNHFSDDEEYSDKTYCYNTFIADLKSEDDVIVDTKYGLSVARFVKYSASIQDESLATDWIIQKVDVNSFNREYKNYQEKQKLLEEMRRVQQATSEMEFFKKLAETSPEMRKLLDEYEKL